MTYTLSVTDEHGMVIYQTTVSLHTIESGEFTLCYAGATIRLGKNVKLAIEDHEAKAGNA